METLAIILIIYGALLLTGLLFQFPFFYNNAKSKALIKMMGKKGYNILLLVFGLGTLIAGIIILT
jgi:hypothetical protein